MDSKRGLGALLSDKLLRTGGWLFAAAMVGNVFAYGFQVAMGRLLAPAEYGFLNSLLAVFVVLNVPLTTVPMVLSKRAAEYAARGENSRIRALFGLATRRVLLAGLVAAAAVAAGSRGLAAYLHAPSVVPVLILGACAFTAFAVPVNTGLLQGLQDYRWLGISTGAAGPLKFAFCAALAAAGFGVNGVLWGLVAANAAQWLLAYVPLRPRLREGEAGAEVAELSFEHLFPVFAANLGFTVLTQADLIVVTRYFPAREAGMYAAAAILGRSVMYVPTAFTQALFPMVSERHELKLGSRHLLLKSLAATLALSGFGAALFFYFPGFVLRACFGPGYAAAAPLLRWFGLAMLPMAALTLLMNYSIAKGEKAFAYVLAAGGLAMPVLVRFHHEDPLAVVAVLGGLGSALAVLGPLIRKMYASRR